MRIMKWKPCPMRSSAILRNKFGQKTKCAENFIARKEMGRDNQNIINVSGFKLKPDTKKA